MRCRNCERLGSQSWFEAVNCGAHDWYDPEKEAAERWAKKEAHLAWAAPIVSRLRALGFEAGVHEVSLLDNGFRFDHPEPPTYRQLDRLAKEFGTKKINFVRDHGYYDTAGYHPEGYVDVLEPTR